MRKSKFPLTFRGRPCRLYRELNARFVVIQFEQGQVSVVAWVEVEAADRKKAG